MIPPLIVDTCFEKGINLIAVTDHNATANAAAVQESARGTNLKVLPGMELQTQEEVHLLCLFDTLDQAHEWQVAVDNLLPPLMNRPEFFGDQLVVDPTGKFLSREERLLAVSAQMSLEQAIAGVNHLGGLAVPAHVDRHTNGLIAVLGLVPKDAGIEALEITARLDPAAAIRQFPQIAGYPLLKGGDAHMLDAIAGMNIFEVEEPTISELRLALANANGRHHRMTGMDNSHEIG